MCIRRGSAQDTSGVTEPERLGIDGRALAHNRAFLENRDAQVRAAGVCSTARRMTREVLQCSVLSPLFSVALAALPEAALIGEWTNRPVHMAVYADDSPIRVADQGCCRESVQKELQKAVDNIFYFLTKMGLTLSEAKTVALLNAPSGTYKFTLDLHIPGTLIPIKNQATYLGLKLDHGVSWQPDMSAVLNNNRNTTSILRILEKVRRDPSQRMMLQL